jgi:hypothetical protein
VRGPLSTNDGEAALSWALDGHGIVLRSEWDAAPYLRSGRLQLLLEDWSAPPADIYILFPTKSHLQAKTRAMVDFMLDAFADKRRTERTRSGATCCGEPHARDASLKQSRCCRAWQLPVNNRPDGGSASDHDAV